MQSVGRYGFLSGENSSMFWVHPHQPDDFINRRLLKGQDLEYPMHSIGYFPTTQSHRLYYTVDSEVVDESKPISAKYWLLSQDYDSNWRMYRTMTHAIRVDVTSEVRDQISELIPKEIPLPSQINLSYEDNSCTVGIPR
jgi:hypothetical protein